MGFLSRTKTGVVFAGIILYSWAMIFWYDGIKAKLKRRAR